MPMHRRAAGERASNSTWEDTRTDLIADAATAWAVKQAHQWATIAWERTTEPIHKYILMQERQRLARIGSALRARM